MNTPNKDDRYWKDFICSVLIGMAIAVVSSLVGWGLANVLLLLWG